MAGCAVGLLVTSMMTACRPVAEPTDDAAPLVLPRSTSDLLAGVGTEVEIATGGIRVAGVALPGVARAGSPAGAVTDDAHATRTLPALREALAPHAAAHRPSAARDELRDLPALRMRVVADRRVAFATLADVLRTATDAGYFEFELAVEGNGGGTTIAIAVPSSWLPPLPEGVKVCRESPIFVELTPAGARGLSHDGKPTAIAARDGCVPGSAACLDREALAAFAAQMKADMPHNTVVTIRVDDAVSVELLVATTDVLRGESCRLHGAMVRGEEVPEACLLWQPILETLPPSNPPG